MKTLFPVLLVAFLLSCGTVKQPLSENPVKATFPNIKIHENQGARLGPCEPSIVINPKNSNNIVAGSVLNHVYHSIDGGKTWTINDLTSPLGVYGDPCLMADNQGNTYYAHLANPEGKGRGSDSFINQIVIQKSTDEGKTWSSGVGIGKNEPKKQDKHWVALHPKTQQIYVTWTEFDVYGSAKPEHKSRIRFATSTDYADTFSDAITISDAEGDALDDDNTTEGAVPAVDYNGTIYVAWAANRHLYFDKSYDNGKTWGTDQIIAQQVQGWAQTIPGIGRCNGMPVTTVDNSNSAYRGTIYVNYTDQKPDGSDTDVYLIRSTDKGKTWSAPIRVNQDQTQTHQFFTWMSIDPITGYVYIIYYDRSHYSDHQTDVCLAVSKNGGERFEQFTISEHPFTPTEEVFFGDYNHIAAYNGSVRPIWTRYDQKKLSIWTALVQFD